MSDLRSVHPAPTELRERARIDDALWRLGPGVAASMSTEPISGMWVPAVEDPLARMPHRAPAEPADTRIGPMSAGPSQCEFGADVQPVPARRNNSGLRTRLLSVDIAAAATTWLVLGGVGMSDTTTVRRVGSALVATFVTLAAMRMLGLYRSRFCVQRGPERVRILLAVVAGAVTFVLLRGNGADSHDWAIVAAGSCALALIVLRWIFEQWLCAQRARGRYLRGVVMIGTNDDAIEVLTMLRSQPELGYEVRGIVGKARSCPELAALPSTQTLDDLPGIATEADATGVLVLANALSGAEMNRVIELSSAHGLHVQVCPGFRGLATRRVRRVPLSGEVFLYLEPGRRPTWQLRAKRVLDIVGAAVGLLIVTPILLMAWVAIRLEDRGPAIYRQVRIGLNGQPFVVYKLRSMVLDADQGTDHLATVNERTDGPLFKSTHDPRVTRVGAVIRALSIDELPQLFNVLAGKMSLVGPRPALACEVAQFDSELLRRHNVKQGITGLWQVEARDNPSFHAYRRLDLFYVDNWSIGLDLMILLTTVPMLIAHALRRHRPAGVTPEASAEA